MVKSRGQIELWDWSSNLLQWSLYIFISFKNNFLTKVNYVKSFSLALVEFRFKSARYFRAGMKNYWVWRQKKRVIQCEIHLSAVSGRLAQVFIKVPYIQKSPVRREIISFPKNVTRWPRPEHSFYFYQVQQTTYSQYNQFLARPWTGVLQHRLDEFSKISLLSIAVKISNNFFFAFR